MATTEDVLRLGAWLSPAFPVGAYAYSHGIEAAIEQGWIHDAATLEDWLDDLLDHGGPKNDAVAIAAIMRGEDPIAVDALLRAFQPSAELRAESLDQGRAFVRAIAGAWPAFAPERPLLSYACAFGHAARAAAIAPEAAIAAYLAAFFANLVSAAIRAVPLGQSDGLAVIAAFETRAIEAARRARFSTLDDLGGCALMSDLAAISHETQRTRLFRS